MWLYIDNGKDYRSRMIEGTGEQAYQPGKLNSEITADNALLKCLGIGVHHALPWRARSKTIERAFGLWRNGSRRCRAIAATRLAPNRKS